jgi:hypothetical protein
MNKEKITEKLNEFFGDINVKVFMPKQFLANLSTLLTKQNEVLIEQIKVNNISPELVKENKKTHELLIELKDAIKKNKVEKVEVTNLKEYPKFPEIKIPAQNDIKIPEYPKEINLKEPVWYEKIQNKLIGFLIDAVNVLKKSFASDLDRHMEKENAIAVRLVTTNKESFYNALFYGGGGGGIAANVTVAGFVTDLDDNDIATGQTLPLTINENYIYSKIAGNWVRLEGTDDGSLFARIDGIYTPNGDSITDDATDSVKISDGGNTITVDGTVTANPTDYATLLAVDSGDPTITYIGSAATGSAVGAAAWKIKRMTEVGTSITIDFADGNATADNIWSNREGLSYS